MSGRRKSGDGFPKLIGSILSSQKTYVVNDQPEAANASGETNQQGRRRSLTGRFHPDDPVTPRSSTPASSHLPGGWLTAVRGGRGAAAASRAGTGASSTSSGGGGSSRRSPSLAAGCTSPSSQMPFDDGATSTRGGGGSCYGRSGGRTSPFRPTPFEHGASSTRGGGGGGYGRSGGRTSPFSQMRFDDGAASTRGGGGFGRGGRTSPFRPTPFDGGASSTRGGASSTRGSGGGGYGRSGGRTSPFDQTPFEHGATSTRGGGGDAVSFCHPFPPSYFSSCRINCGCLFCSHAQARGIAEAIQLRAAAKPVQNNDASQGDTTSPPKRRSSVTMGIGAKRRRSGGFGSQPGGSSSYATPSNSSNNDDRPLLDDVPIWRPESRISLASTVASGSSAQATQSALRHVKSRHLDGLPNAPPLRRVDGAGSQTGYVSSGGGSRASSAQHSHVPSGRSSRASQRTDDAPSGHSSHDSTMQLSGGRGSHGSSTHEGRDERSRATTSYSSASQAVPDRSPTIGDYGDDQLTAHPDPDATPTVTRRRQSSGGTARRGSARSLVARSRLAEAFYSNSEGVDEYPTGFDWRTPLHHRFSKHQILKMTPEQIFAHTGLCLTFDELRSLPNPTLEMFQLGDTLCLRALADMTNGERTLTLLKLLSVVSQGFFDRGLSTRSYFHGHFEEMPPFVSVERLSGVNTDSTPQRGYLFMPWERDNAAMAHTRMTAAQHVDADLGHLVNCYQARRSEQAPAHSRFRDN